MTGYVQIFKVNYGDEDKSNKLMSFRKDDEKLLEKYKTILTNVEDLKSSEMDVLPIRDVRYAKSKIR